MFSSTYWLTISFFLLFNCAEKVDACIVHQDVDAAKAALCLHNCRCSIFVPGHVQREGQSGIRVMCDKLAHRTEVSCAQHSAVTLFQYVLGKSKTEATGCSRYSKTWLIKGASSGLGFAL